MCSKVLLVLAVFMATVILISSEVVPKQFDQNFDTKDGKHGAIGIDESKYWGGYGWYGRPWYGYGYGPYWGGGYGGPWYGWRRRWGGWGGGWRAPNEHVEANVHAEPNN